MLPQRGPSCPNLHQVPLAHLRLRLPPLVPTSFQLPALKHLGDLAGRKPVIVYDSREQTPLCFTQLEAVRGTLQTGDYSILGAEHLFSVERKSITDLVGCCCGSSRERFERELRRLRGHQFRRLVVIGRRSDVEAGNYHSGVKPQSVLASLDCWEVRFDCPVLWCTSPEAAARQIESWAWWYSRELVGVVNDLYRAVAAGRSKGIN